MVFTKDFKFPSDDELTVEECPLGTPYLKAGASHLGKYCENQNNEFVLCRHETRDPIKCLPEGKVVTACTNEFFRKVKQNCATAFTQHAMCLEQSSDRMKMEPCRQSQVIFDGCMKDKLGMDRPHYGYHSLIRVHDSTRCMSKVAQSADLGMFSAVKVPKGTKKVEICPKRPQPELERPAWLDDPRGSGKRVDVLPDDFPRADFYGKKTKHMPF